jgi:hypothetical protein
MLRKTTVKDDKPVNISISFNISPNEIVKPHKEKFSTNDIRGRKIRNLETIKSHRDTPLNNYFVPLSQVTHRPDNLTERETFSRDETQ